MRKIFLKNQFLKKTNFIDKKIIKYQTFLQIRFLLLFRQNNFLKQNYLSNFKFFLKLKFFLVSLENLFFNKFYKNKNFNYSLVSPFFLFEKQFLFKQLDFKNFLISGNLDYYFYKKIFSYNF